MLKLMSFIYNAGRRKAYSEIISELVELDAGIIRTREGAKVRQEIQATIERLKSKQDDEEAK